MSRGFRIAFWCFLLVAGSVAVWKWSSLLLRSTSDFQQQTNQLRRTMADAEAMMARRHEVARETADLAHLLLNRTSAFLPDHDQPLPWVVGNVSSLSQATGLQFQSIEPLTAPVIPHARDAPPRMFDAYRILCIMEGSLTQCLTFIRKAQHSNPYLHVAGLRISTPPTSQQEAVIQLTLEWPIWSDPATLERVEAINRRLQAETNQPAFLVD